MLLHPCRWRCRLVAAAAAMVVIGLSPRSADAQAVQGRVVDGDTDRPVAGASAVLRSAVQVVRATADSAGWFRVVAPRAGEYTLEVSHRDYVDVRTMRVTVEAGRTQDVFVRLQRSVVAGDTLVAAATARDLSREATFEGAMARHRSFPQHGFRRVVTHEDPELRNAMKVSEVLRWFPVGGCTILLYDGTVPRGDGADWMELSATSAEAVEFYRRPYQAPQGIRERALAGAPESYMEDCSIVALWSRRTPTETRHGLLKLVGTVAASALLVMLLR